MTNVLLVASFPASLLHFRGPLIAALQAEGFVVHVAAPDLPAGSLHARALLLRGIKVHDIYMSRTGTNPVRDVMTCVHLWWVMRAVRPCIFLGYTAKPVIYGSLAAWLARVPNRFALITGLGYAFQGGKGRSKVRRLVQGMYALALGKVDKVLFQNPDDQALFRERKLLPDLTPSAVVHGTGIDLTAYKSSVFPRGPLRFLMIGRLLGDKGVREFAEAALRIRAVRPDIGFGLIGWIDDNPDSIAQSELDVWIAEGAIEFLGRLSDVRPAIAACTVYVLPSYREGTPRTVLEAMAMGRPIITTDAPGCRETVIDGENGFLVPVKSVDALVASMLRFINEPELAARMGARSREIAEEKYDVNNVNAVMLREMGIITPKAFTEGAKA